MKRLIMFDDYHKAAVEFGKKRMSLENLYNNFTIEFRKISSEYEVSWTIPEGELK